MVILIAVVVILVTILIALVLAAAIKGLDNAVITSGMELEAESRSYNPAVTLGYQIPVAGDPDEQLKEARKIAAQQAAATPRGANMKIGPQYKKEEQATAFDGVNSDPITAVKIASFHGWDGVQTGIVAVDPAAAAAPTSTPAAGGKIKLIPGQDYPVIEITDGMSPDEKRKARIANAKAKSAAMKAAKAAQDSGSGAPVAVAPAAVATAPAAAPAAAAGVPEPEYIEITDDMTPEEKRKARIANSKAKSAYNKALKAAGVTTSAAPAAAAPAAASAPAAAPVAASAPVPETAAGIAKPELIEITDDMSPDEKRKARIANSKAKSAYNKALKAAGIDPKSVA
jgi:hypothetical protein